MKVLLLAAGRGSRMGPLTRENPKCLVPLLGKSLLEWQLQSFHSANLPKPLAILGYKKEKLLPYFTDYFINEKWESTNMAKTLLQASAILEKHEVIISYTDIVFHPDVLLTLCSGKHDICITYDKLWKCLWDFRFSDALEDAETFQEKNGLLSEIGRKTQNSAEIQGQYMGLIKTTPKGWSQIKPLISDAISMTELFSQLLIKGVKIQALPIYGKWCECDSEKDVAIYEQKLLSSDPWTHDFRTLHPLTC